MRAPAAAAATDPARLHAVLIKTSSSERAAYHRVLSLYPAAASLRLLLRGHLPFPPTHVSFTAALSSPSHSPSSLFLLLRLILRRSPPLLLSDGALSAALKSLSHSLPLALPLHSLALKLSLSRLPFSASALVSLYSKSRLPLHALKVFDDIPHPDPVCFSAAIVALAQNRRPAPALALFVSMRSRGTPSTMYAVSAALRAAADLAALDLSRSVHAHALVVGLHANLFVATALVDAYGKAGLVADARRVFDALLGAANLVTWNAMLAAHAQQGDLAAALDVFDEMLRRDFAPDDLTFLAVLTACSNAGAADEAERWIELMESRYGVTPGLAHYTCLVGAMARVGRLDDAERVALAMPFDPDAAVWRTLLSGSVIHRRADTAESAGRRLLELDPHDDSAYVMLANVYSATGKMDEVAELWTAMRDRGVKKEGGRSWVEVRGEVHVFVANERRHARTGEIYGKLKELMGEVKKLGYGEEDEGLWYHSERLAVAFGMLSGAAPKGKELRVVKNLRICGDCHEFFKYVSRVIEREIVVRDVNRYHRFQNGSCTCRDYW